MRREGALAQLISYKMLICLIVLIVGLRLTCPPEEPLRREDELSGDRRIYRRGRYFLTVIKREFSVICTFELPTLIVG